MEKLILKNPLDISRFPGQRRAIFNLLEEFRNLGMVLQREDRAVILWAAQSHLMVQNKLAHSVEVQQKLDFVSLLPDLVPADDSQAQK